MSDKQDIQIALAAAVGANCIPCFDHLFEKTKEAGLTTEEILHVVHLAFKVKNGAHIFLKTHINDTLGIEDQDITEGCCGPAGKDACNC